MVKNKRRLQMHWKHAIRNCAAFPLDSENIRLLER
jgi:hypothetical protein